MNLKECLKFMVLFRQNDSSLIFFVLNMVRSKDYDIMMPSLTLKIKDELKEKEASYQ
jgi:hypothetical protein